jgi:flagellar hook-length control protein FliK
VAADACVTTVDAGASKGTVRPTPPAADAEARAAKAEDRKPVGIEPVDAKAAGEHAAVIAAADERPATNKPAERSAAADGVSALAPAAGVHAPARAEAPAAAQPVNLPTPVHSPEFKAALGMQVSLLARDGVQHAELHLNPAEMGPISVQIALDGSRAQVDFGAESAHTRHLIETGLPELAAALRDAGLTLAGGGVSQHARGGQPQGDAAPRERDDAAPRGVDPADAGPATARRVNLRLPQGAVDLYA